MLPFADNSDDTCPPDKISNCCMAQTTNVQPILSVPTSNETIPRLRVVFDVESVGVYGEAFAVGWVAIDQDGMEVESGIFCCPSNLAKGRDSDREWIEKHVVPTLPPTNCESPFDVRCAFWARLHSWRLQRAEFWADCGYPVEAKFLIDCVLDDQANRVWTAPYPLNEIASVLKLTGKDPLGTYPRLDRELPVHNPICDARQSARLLHESTCNNNDR